MSGLNEDLRAIAAAFSLAGRLVDGRPYGSGHINDTFALSFQTAAGRRRYVLQRINSHVFKNVPALMSNVERVTSRVRAHAQAQCPQDASRRALSLVPTHTGAAYHVDASGAFWRCYDFVEGATSHDVIRRPEQARQAARAFGEFQRALVDLSGARLHETIPFFHHTRRRFETLKRAIAADVAGRATGARSEIEFALSREGMVDVLIDLQAKGDVPERITHNDTKLNNVLLDDQSGEGVCVIDLDTVMPGLALYDFGDMVRTATNAAAEDETDLTKVEPRLPIFEALAEGYLSTAADFLNQAETSQLVFSGRLMTFEVGIRFLTDYLEGDVYFKTKHTSHNLERARNQFALLRSLERHASAMEAIVNRCLAT